MSHENIMRLWNDAAKGGIVRPKLRTIVKTGTSYTITPADFGTVFTTRGGSGMTFTLPAVASVYDGEWVLFLNVADQNLMVIGTDEELVVFNDLTADGIGFVTSSEKIGGGLFAICDGTSWIVLPLATETQTVKVATAASSSPSTSVSASPSSSPSTSVSNTPSTSVSATPTSSPSASVSSSPSSSPSTSPSST